MSRFFNFIVIGALIALFLLNVFFFKFTFFYKTLLVCTLVIGIMIKTTNTDELLNVLSRDFPLFWTYLSVGFLQTFVILEIVSVTHEYRDCLVIIFSILCLTFLEFRCKTKSITVKFIFDFTFFTILLPGILIFLSFKINILHIILAFISISTVYKQGKISNSRVFLSNHINSLKDLGWVVFVKKPPSGTPNLIAAFKRTKKYKTNTGSDPGGKGPGSDNFDFDFNAVSWVNWLIPGLGGGLLASYSFEQNQSEKLKENFRKSRQDSIDILTHPSAKDKSDEDLIIYKAAYRANCSCLVDSRATTFSKSVLYQIQNGETVYETNYKQFLTDNKTNSYKFEISTSNLNKETDLSVSASDGCNIM